jgi:hypothetical protein
MRTFITLALLLGLLTSFGCSPSKSTDELVADISSTQEGDRVKAVRLLQRRDGEAEKVVPALMKALSDKKNSSDVRWSAAIGLGYFGDEARDAIPTLKQAGSDPDARVREAAAVALSRIDPEHFQPPSGKRPPAKK